MIPLAIVGPTASGKSALAMRIAELQGGEIVSADSRQVYRGLDIGTAKPTVDERHRVRHHMLDVADPGERYDVARYQREGRAVLADLAARGVRAIVVGGTGLYLRALLDGLDLASMPRDPEVRAALERDAERDGAEALHRRLAAIDPDAAARADPRNVRRVIRYLEIATIAGGASAFLRRADGSAREEHGSPGEDRGSPREEQRIAAWKIGLRPPREELARRIERRVRDMMAAGVLDETARLIARGVDPTLPSMTGHGYPHWARHLRGEIDLETAIALTVRDTKAYSRRQMTWFRKDPGVRWCDPSAGDAMRLVAEALS